MAEVYDLLDKDYSANYATVQASSVTSQEFDVTFNYIREIIITDVAILAAGVVALMIFWLAMLFRCCVPCCRCAPKEKQDDDDDDEVRNPPIYLL
ncbi:hypothetical protein EON65_42560 [archaeon]|nr:MAG: hypothetical protein EON65_42560 [archaeon]